MPTTARFIGILRDLTAERGRAEALASARRLAAILNGIDVFVGLLDPSGRLLEINDAALRAAGLDRQDVIGVPLEQTFWISHSPETQERVRRAVRLAARGKTAREELSVRLAQDRLIVVESAFAPVLDAAGQVVEIVGPASTSPGSGRPTGS